MKEKINEENILKILTEININRYKRNRVENQKEHNRGITLIALVITIVLNSSYLAMDRINKIEKI